MASSDVEKTRRRRPFVRRHVGVSREVSDEAADGVKDANGQVVARHKEWRVALVAQKEMGAPASIKGAATLDWTLNADETGKAAAEERAVQRLWAQPAPLLVRSLTKSPSALVSAG